MIRVRRALCARGRTVRYAAKCQVSTNRWELSYPRALKTHTLRQRGRVQKPLTAYLIATPNVRITNTIRLLSLTLVLLSIKEISVTVFEGKRLNWRRVLVNENMIREGVHGVFPHGLSWCLYKRFQMTSYRQNLQYSATAIYRKHFGSVFLDN